MCTRAYAVWEVAYADEMSKKHLRKRLHKFLTAHGEASRLQFSLCKLAYAYKSTSAYAKSLHRLHCTAKHTWSAYATYHTVTFVLDFMISKINDAQLTIVILLQEVSVSVHACTTINHLQPLTRTKLCTCGVVGRHVACTLQISQSHMSHSTTSMRHTQSPVRVQTHDTVTSKLKSTMCPYITCLSVLCAIDTYTLLCIYRIHKKLRTGSLDFELKYK